MSKKEYKAVQVGVLMTTSVLLIILSVRKEYLQSLAHDHLKMRCSLAYQDDADIYCGK